MEIIVRKLDGTEGVIKVKALTKETLPDKIKPLIKNLVKKYKIDEEKTNFVYKGDNIFVEEEVVIEEEENFEIVEASKEETNENMDIVEVLKSIDETNKQLVENIKQLPAPQTVALQDSEDNQIELKEYREKFLTEVISAKDIIINMNEVLEKNHVDNGYLIEEIKRINMGNSKKNNIVDKVISIVNVILVIILVAVLIISLGN